MVTAVGTRVINKYSFARGTVVGFLRVGKPSDMDFKLKIKEDVPTTQDGFTHYYPFEVMPVAEFNEKTIDAIKADEAQAEKIRQRIERLKEQLVCFRKEDFMRDFVDQEVAKMKEAEKKPGLSED